MCKIIIVIQQDIVSTMSPAHEGPEPAETDYDEPEDEYEEEYTDPSGNLAEK